MSTFRLPTPSFTPPSHSGKAREHLVMLLILLMAGFFALRACAAPSLAYSPDGEAESSVHRYTLQPAEAASQTAGLAQTEIRDPRVDFPWPTDVGFRNHRDTVVAAFNYARGRENADSSTVHLKPITLPDDVEWQAMSDGDKMLWLINEERTVRGLAPLHGLETNVTQVAQAYAEYLLANGKFDHNADGRTPPQRLQANEAIGACHDFLPQAENLAYKATLSRQEMPLIIERAVYEWMHDDSQSKWGHRHAILLSYTENSGDPDREGFLGVGHARGAFVIPEGKYKGETMPNSHIVVMNIFDPCAGWQYAPPPKVEPPPAPELPPVVEPKPNTHAVSGQVTLPTWTTIEYQPFERDTWPGAWEITDETGTKNGEYHWIASTCRVYAGTYSGMAVGGGADGINLECGASYPNNVRSWMIFGPFSLENAIAAELRAKVWVYTEPYNDMLCLLASTDRKTFNGPCVSGYSQGWVDEVFDLNQVYRMGSLLGRKNVYVALAFITDAADTRPHSGVFVDNIWLRAGIRAAGATQAQTDSATASHPLHAVIVSDEAGNLTTTELDGTFTLEGLPPGRHMLVPDQTGYQFYPPYFMVDIVDRDVEIGGFTASNSPHHTIYMPVARR